MRNFKLLAIFCACTARFVSTVRMQLVIPIQVIKCTCLEFGTFLSRRFYYENISMKEMCTKYLYTAPGRLASEQLSTRMGLAVTITKLAHIYFFTYILLIFAHNIDRGYTLEPPGRSLFWIQNKKNCIPQFYHIKVGYKGVFDTRT